jgi:hypothetical protein
MLFKKSKECTSFIFIKRKEENKLFGLLTLKMESVFLKLPWILLSFLGGIHEGHKFTPDAVFILSDDDFVAIINGDEDPQ